MTEQQSFTTSHKQTDAHCHSLSDGHPRIQKHPFFLLLPVFIAEPDINEVLNIFLAIWHQLSWLCPLTGSCPFTACSLAVFKKEYCKYKPSIYTVFYLVYFLLAHQYSRYDICNLLRSQI